MQCTLPVCACVHMFMAALHLISGVELPRVVKHFAHGAVSSEDIKCQLHILGAHVKRNWMPVLAIHYYHPIQCPLYNLEIGSQSKLNVGR